jgi:hypothetical protein
MTQNRAFYYWKTTIVNITSTDIFSYYNVAGYENYESAHKACKRAEDTSNLESCSDDEKRPRKKPRRYDSDSDHGNEADKSRGEGNVLYSKI